MNQGQWILILGASSDIAIACARRYGKEKYNLYLASRNTAVCEKIATDIQVRFKVTTRTLTFDAVDFASHQSFYESLPTKPIGVIFAAGLMTDQQSAQQDFNQAKAMIDTNYAGAISILEIIAQDFTQRKAGFIAAISSVAGDRGRQSNYIYGSTKAGLTAYLAGLSHRLSFSGVTLLTVKPGFVNTKMTAGLNLPDRLTAQPEEVADAIFDGLIKKKSVIYVKPIWRWIMLIIIHLPNFIFHRTKL
ncbi:SDR family oxidoreductase [Candidatus Nitrosacidococcus tergens]|uniref:Short-chain dehydrogenase/reductase SDR n=1 Tax=Candidatus Nitrosacidococcus tergens TaxID=553981 RepID=A0A7G1Q950_9GAMM|nr:SDR family oxidoreductase [Candidatus Nitrosacidococcus tergens]CAB1275717.1 Short-chain dehydrogenase/reductase SDR [Candidatus Nitrosacidococcus tergens]